MNVNLRTDNIANPELNLINHMDRHNLASHQLGSSYFFFPNYESHFPDNGGSPGCASRHEETIPDSPSNDPKFFKPAPFFRFRHPSSPTIESGNRIEADTELILRYLYEATQNSNMNTFPDDLTKASGSSSNFITNSSRLPLVTYLKRLWRHH
ncbi:hypothetical protein H4Q26_007763 [Puccinia striiformis f. sp. tritici PST-130]|nr:hypothetical protein H4Q26_007763 [Puccinia striiformis f. sp. tritici PST-130]